jgi:hypothetical protein
MNTNRTPHDYRTQLFKMSWIPIVRYDVVNYRNSPDNSSLKDFFDERYKKEFIRDNVLGRRKLAKRSNYKRRICKQSLTGEEPLKINQDAIANTECLLKSMKKIKIYQESLTSLRVIKLSLIVK